MARIAACLVMMGCAFVAGSAHAQTRTAKEKAALTALEVKTAEDDYLRYCAVCHGVDGRGSGPIADAMKIAPTDLTRLAQRHNGEFPSARITDVIRNGGGVLGHGSSPMLAWGYYFREKRSAAANEARIRLLVRYIESLQGK